MALVCAATETRELWYALLTRARHEKAVHRQLLQKQIPAFLPTISCWSRWTDRNKQIERPLFPGYCFASFNPACPLPVMTCAGVLTIVSFGGVPAAIPSSELDSIRLLVASKTTDCEPHASLCEGTLVEVVNGPLSGVVGRLLRKDLTHASIVLSIDVIGHGVRVQVKAADVVLR
jgi:transcription antitermination factor NusG